MQRKIDGIFRARCGVPRLKPGRTGARQGSLERSRRRGMSAGTPHWPCRLSPKARTCDGAEEAIGFEQNKPRDGTDAGVAP